MALNRSETYTLDVIDIYSADGLTGFMVNRGDAMRLADTINHLCRHWTTICIEIERAALNTVLVYGSAGTRRLINPPPLEEGMTPTRAPRGKTKVTKGGKVRETSMRYGTIIGVLLGVLLAGSVAAGEVEYYLRDDRSVAGCSTYAAWLRIIKSGSFASGFAAEQANGTCRGLTPGAVIRWTLAEPHRIEFNDENILVRVYVHEVDHQALYWLWQDAIRSREKPEPMPAPKEKVKRPAGAKEKR